MQDSVLNLCRVKMRDQQRLERGPLREYPNRSFNGVVPRSGNASGGGHPGSALRCAPGGPNDYVYLIVQPQIWEALCNEIGRPELITDPKYATPEARVPILDEVFGIIEQWTQKYTKYEVLERCNALDIPCGPVLAMKELLEDESLRARGMIAEVEHPQRGTYYTVGCPLGLSDSTVDYRRAPLLGEHNEELLGELMGYDAAQVENLRAEGVI
jgi:formyl-CoA transferase